MSQKEPQNKALGIFVGNLVFILIMGIVLFLAAGRLDYWQGWVLLGSFFLTRVMILISMLKNPASIRESGKSKIESGWDQTFYTMYNILSMITLIIGGLDVGRFHWSGSFPIGLYVISVALFLGASILVMWAEHVNRHFTGVVRSSSIDDEQTVATTGPYRVVRHPGYLGMILTWVASALILGSIWSLVSVGIITGLFVISTAFEDQTLRTKLSGYDQYAQKVRYRLFPGLW